ncbi:hypothetical protein MSIMFB_02545 [Mycobacterium simulans]|uniref:Uncharacterized protein n=1 Tax=Mycobacterium simulans TaxID=627089 RepID=A0A7Z7NAN8_9MYCO|nr:hypothetical protein MSIMFB_02545 [Mycobacterium simulans]
MGPDADEHWIVDCCPAQCLRPIGSPIAAIDVRESTGGFTLSGLRTSVDAEVLHVDGEPAWGYAGGISLRDGSCYGRRPEGCQAAGKSGWPALIPQIDVWRTRFQVCPTSFLSWCVTTATEYATTSHIPIRNIARTRVWEDRCQ